MKIAERLKGLRDFNWKRVVDDDDDDDDDDYNDDDDDENGPRPPRSLPPPPYDFSLYNISLSSLPPTTSNNYAVERMPASREKVAIAEKLKLSENINKLFSKADETFNKNNCQKALFDDAESISKPDEMTIPQAQAIKKELKKGKLPK